MKSIEPVRRPSLRQEQAAVTRRRILEGVEAMLLSGADEVSYQGVSRAAQVPERTLYRHFPTKGDLLRAYWSLLDERLGSRGMPTTEAALLADVRAVMARFDDIAPVMRAALLSKEGREMRMSVQPERVQAFRAALADATTGLAPSQRTRVCAIIQLLYSGYAWLSMREHWNLDGKEAGEASAWAIETLLRSLKRSDT
ncbi:MAG: TetR/AcrR family transcriptional regulator [Planctomycetes bacterium]|nr:TetR/AcrR family transcriptional regulator [Planctomycetota bacterium]